MQHACPYYGIPGIIAGGCHFAQVKSNDPAPGRSQQVKQVVHLLKSQPAGNRGTGIGTKFRGKPIYIKAYVNLVRKAFKDPVTLFPPCKALVHVFVKRMVGKKCYACIIADYLVFLTRIITDTHLCQGGD